jgi:hypothetical protein
MVFQVSDLLVPLPQSDYYQLLTRVAELFEQAKKYSARTVNAIMTQTYWDIGRRIVEREQQGKKRAAYGEALIERLALDSQRSSHIHRARAVRNISYGRLGRL